MSSDVFKVTGKVFVVSFAFSLLLVFMTGHGYGQLAPAHPKPRPLNEAYKDVFNDCDKEVAKNNPAAGECRTAVPRLNAGDCLMSETSCLAPLSAVTQLIAHPDRTKILDQAGNTVIIKNEAFALSALVMARDQATLEDVLRNTEIQGRVGNRWVTRRPLRSTEYGPLTNLRHYYFSDCGQAMAAFKGDFAKFEKLDTFAHSAVRVGRSVIGPRPAPESLIAAVPSGPPTSRGDLPELPGSEERVLQEMADATMKKAVKDLEAAMRGPSCPDKPLPYYWAPVFVRYSPELNETRVRLYSRTMRTHDIVLTDPFKVYSAAASKFIMPNHDGNRDFSLKIFAPGDATLTANASSVLYKEGTSSAEHRAAVTMSANAFVVTINDRTVKSIPATGRFPFVRSFWDDVAFQDVSQMVSQAGDVSPIAIEGGATVNYRLEVRPGTDTFASKDSSFMMPPPLTFALMGDSFSAGQGAPFFTSAEGEWLSDNCHRSRWSGQYRAMNRFIKNSNKACDYIFVSCEGATTQDLYSQAQRVHHNPDGTTHGDLKQGGKAQVDLVKDWMTAKGYARLNVAVLGIGGNNTGFADAIQNAIKGAHWVDAWFTGTDDPALQAQIDAGFNRINGSGAGSYKELDTALKTKLNVADVVIFGYPDVTHNSNGTVCRTDCSDPPPFFNGNVVPHTIDEKELAFGDTILTRLTNAVSSAGKLPGWHYVDILTATKNHGICNCGDIFFTTWTVATTPWPVSWACAKGWKVGALLNGASCSFHPNPRGYEQYITPILNQLNALHGN